MLCLRATVVIILVPVAVQTVWAQVNYKLESIAFSPYVDNQDPANNVPVSALQIQQRMAIVAPYTRGIRTFGCLNGLGEAGRIAHSFGLKAAIGIWIGRDLAANEREIACGISAAVAGDADTIIVGSEVLLRRDVDESRLLGYLATVQARIPAQIPVTTADVYGVLLAHPAVIAASDIVFANFYPFWEGYPVESAIGVLESSFNQVVAAAKGKPVVISETGWPSAGNTVGAAVPSAQNAARHFLHFISWARRRNVRYHYFTALDELWKVRQEGPQGAAWGVWDRFGNLKPGMGDVFAGIVVPEDPPGSTVCGGAGTPDIAIDLFGPLGGSQPVYGRVNHVIPANHKIAVVIQVRGGWWSKPYFTAPLTNILGDCTFTAPIVTGGVDNEATRVRAYLFPNGYTPPLLGGSASVPAAYETNAIDWVEQARGDTSICGVIRSGGVPLPGATLTAAGTTAASSRTINTGEYCLAGLSSGGTYTIKPSRPAYRFSPVSYAVSPLVGNRTVDFMAIPTDPASLTSKAGVYRHGVWDLLDTAGSLTGVLWGNSSLLPVAGDWNGNGRSKVGAYDPATGNWYLDTNGSGIWDTGDLAFRWGGPGFTPVQGDWSGDGRTRIGVYQPSTGIWYLDMNGNGTWDAGDRAFAWGNPGLSVPVVGDWNGDGRIKAGVYTPSTGIWNLDMNGSGIWDSGDAALAWGFAGAAGLTPVVGDWNGDGRAKVGVVVQGVWYLDIDGSFTFDGGDKVFRWGSATAKYLVGDWDGDGRSTVGAIEGDVWYLDVNGSTIFDTGDRVFAWGQATDVPVVGNW